MADQKSEQIIRGFKKKKKIQTFITVVVFAVAFFAIWFSNNRDRFPDETLRMAITYSICAVAIGGLLVSYINWKCPACGSHLGRALNMNKCKKCGAKLR